MSVHIEKFMWLHLHVIYAKIVGQPSPSEGVQGGWGTFAGIPGYYSWASNVMSFCVFFAAGRTPHQAFFSQPTHTSLASW